MQIIFKKGAIKNTITCNRPDGTATWMQAEPFMVMHDLTHYVVETQFDLHDSFYGLLARGWDVTDFENKQKIKSSDIPGEGICTEILVGLLLTERNDGQEMSDFNTVFSDSCSKLQLTCTPPEDDVLRKLRMGLDEIINKWKFLPIGSTFVVNFPA